MPRVLPVAALVGAAVMTSLPTGASAQDDEACLEPLDYVEELRGQEGIDEITQEKVHNLVEEARQLCDEGEAQVAQEKFSNAAQLLEAALRPN